jgi:DNA-binding response OmpR family regulator
MAIPVKKKIMVVEDDRDVSRIINLVLGGAGYDVLQVDNIAAALTFLGKETVDLAILDRNLPDGDGMEICRAIRRKAGGSVVPVMFITVEKAPDDIADGLEVGADDYLVKPFNRDELLTRVQALLRVNRAQI